MVMPSTWSTSGRVLAVRLVEDQQGARRQRRQHLLHVGRRQHRAGRVVRRAEHHELGLRGELADQRVDVARQVLGRRRQHERPPRHLRRQPVRQERELVGQHLVVGIAERDHHLVEELVRSRAERDVIDADAQLRAERAAQREAAGVGIEVQPAQRGLHRGHRLGRRAERVLVGRHLDGPGDTELALELLHRLAGLIDVEAAHVARCDGIDPVRR
jgi:hypothetical protein